MIFAKAGERIVTPDGKYICKVKNDLSVGSVPFPRDFEDWQYSIPNNGDKFGEGFRAKGTYCQVCIEGEWRP